MESLKKPVHEICVDKTDCEHNFDIDKSGKIEDKSAVKHANKPVHGLCVDKTSCNNDEDNKANK